MTDLEIYKMALRCYHHTISNEEWWDGRRESLVNDMDVVWGRLTEMERREVYKYQWDLYQEFKG